MPIIEPGSNSIPFLVRQFGATIKSLQTSAKRRRNKSGTWATNPKGLKIFNWLKYLVIASPISAVKYEQSAGDTNKVLPVNPPVNLTFHHEVARLNTVHSFADCLYLDLAKSKVQSKLEGDICFPSGVLSNFINSCVKLKLKQSRVHTA